MSAVETTQKSFCEWLTSEDEDMAFPRVLYRPWYRDDVVDSWAEDRGEVWDWDGNNAE